MIQFYCYSLGEVMFTRLIQERDEKGRIKANSILFDGKPIPENKKYCPVCKNLLEKEAFSDKGNACKSCAVEKTRKWRVSKENNPNWRKERNAQLAENSRKLKRKAVVLKGDVCFDCGQQYPDAVYDFHHIDPTQKDFSIGKSRNWSKIEKELEKCVMLCSNCHRIRHFHND
jgi:hypothetical protein